MNSIIMTAEFFNLALLAGYKILFILMFGLFFNYLLSRFYSHDRYYQAIHLHLHNSFLFIYIVVNSYFTSLVVTNSYKPVLIEKSMSFPGFASLMIVVAMLFILGVYVFSNPPPAFTTKGIRPGGSNNKSILEQMIIAFTLRNFFIYASLLTFSLVIFDLSYPGEKQWDINRLKSILSVTEIDYRFITTATILPLFTAIFIGRIIYISHQMKRGYLRRYQDKAMRRHVLLYQTQKKKESPAVLVKNNQESPNISDNPENNISYKQNNM